MKGGCNQSLVRSGRGAARLLRLFVFAFALALVPGMLPAMSQTAYAADTYPLWVGGVQVTSENASDVLADDETNKGKVEFTPASGNDSAVLTLKGANITAGYNDEYGNTNGIYYDGDSHLIIDLQSGYVNSINGVEKCINCNYIGAPLTISGGGTLNASSDVYSGVGILACSDLKIVNSTVNLI